MYKPVVIYDILRSTRTNRITRIDVEPLIATNPTMTAMNRDTICSIWQTPAHEISTKHHLFFGFDSPRAHGQYVIRSDQRSSIKEVLNDPGKARLTTWLINQREQGEGCPDVTREVIEAAQNAQDMSVPKRINRVLQFLGAPRGRRPTEGVTLDPNPEGTTLDGESTAYYELLACSESITWEGDLKALLDYLEKNGLVNRIDLYGGRQYHYALEMSGFERVEELKEVRPDSDQAFVAMWFDDGLKPAYVNGFKRAIKGAGYKPVRIDEQQFTDKIDDRIISEIRRSRFIVADFSQGEGGARGGVYYEAGYAHGLGRKVIFTCRKEDLKHVHFDTRQYNHIVWENAEDLRKQLEERITAVMGDGPLKGRGET